MKAIEKIALGAFLLGAAYIAESYIPDCIVNNHYEETVVNTQVGRTVIKMGKCYFMED